MLKRISILLAVAGILAVTLLVFQLKKPQPAPTPLVEPSRAPYADSIGARGIVESENENVRIAPLLPGLIAEVYVKVGDRVTKGQPLFRQDTRDAEARVANQKAQVGLLDANNWIGLCIEAFQEHAGTRQTLAFFPKVDMSREFARRLNESGISAAHIDATTPKEERTSVLQRYQRGELTRAE